MFHHHLVGTMFFSMFASNHLKQIQFSNVFHFLFQKKLAAIFYSGLTQNFIWWNFTTPVDSSILLKQLDLPPIQQQSQRWRFTYSNVLLKSVIFSVILMVKVSQHPGKGGHHLNIQYQYPPAGSSQPHGKQRETSRFQLNFLCRLGLKTSRKSFASC